MKKTILFLIMLALSIPVTSIYAGEIQLKKKEPPIDPYRPRSPIFIPVTAFIENYELSISFDYPVGSVTVFITDTDENTVHYSVVDTSQQQEVVIPLNSFADGDYILSIEYETTILTGDFSL